MNSKRTAALIAAVRTIARDAGHAILEIYRKDFGVEHKADRTPLTEADMAAHRTIVRQLRDLTPDIPILSEESSHIPYAERRQWERYWLVDPLDGTKEFVKRNDEFTVNIALIEGGASVLGVVHVPVWERDYFAACGDGAYRAERDSEPERIGVSALPEGKVRVAASRSHPSEALSTYLNKLGGYELTQVGSSIKFCLVAEGSADIYVRLGKTSEWDTAAAQCVVEAAGGQVTDTRMQPLRYNTKESLLNPEFLVFGDDSRDWSKYL